jgi:hypothetical protein
MMKNYEYKKRTKLIRNSLLILLTVFLALGGSCRETAYEDSEETAPASKKKEADRGELIVAEYLKRDSSPFRKSRVRMTVKPDQGRTDNYLLETSRKQTEGKTLTLTRVLEPKEDSDIATLTIEKKSQPSVNINYIASQERFRESGTNRMFFGGLTSQELLGEWDKYDSKFLGERKEGEKGEKIWEVESRLKPKADSFIKRIVTHFGTEDYLPKKLSLFNYQDKEIRTFDIIETKVFDEKKAVSKTIIRNHLHKTTVTIEVLDMSFPENIAAEKFERGHLKTLIIDQ